MVETGKKEKEKNLTTVDLN